MKFSIPNSGTETETTTGDIAQEKAREEFKKLIDSGEFDKLAEAFQKGDIQWHANEWKQFIEMIRKEERERCAKIAEEFVHPCTCGTIDNRHDEFCSKFDCANTEEIANQIRRTDE
jgi:hypothetical protein